MDKTTKTVVIFLLIVGSLSLISNSVWKPFLQKESLKISDAQLQDVVNQMNEMTPIFLDDITKLNRVHLEGRTIVYEYILEHDESEDILAFGPLEEAQLNEYCNSNENSYFSKVGVAVTSNYVTRDGGKLHSFTMRPSDCIGS
ncbi:hypothetical protein [Alteromonas sp. KUL150]|uniref:hypothetical protein n=1 Tax=unclassified Alteromonas TaxID=2614992 RepID=UPI0012E6CD42|nr:hypothetical protein [Alteromonas sp. KUL150]GFD77107.1 hypothetical protein KUL113_65270 [Tenacibaculum sp. KUL113]GFD87754.1 hypothetical protein KUL150_38130 [Alteromonas sp. KUL150]